MLLYFKLWVKWDSFLQTPQFEPTLYSSTESSSALYTCKMCFYGNTDKSDSRGSENSVSQQLVTAVVITSSAGDSFSNRISILTRVTCRGYELWDWEEESVHTTSSWEENRLATVWAGFQPCFSLFPPQTHAFLPAHHSLLRMQSYNHPFLSLSIYVWCPCIHKSPQLFTYITPSKHTEL